MNDVMRANEDYDQVNRELLTKVEGQEKRNEYLENELVICNRLSINISDNFTSTFNVSLDVDKLILLIEFKASFYEVNILLIR